MISSHIMIVLIVIIAVAGSVLRARYKALQASAAAVDPEAGRLREEVKALKERVAVLERIATDKNNLLEQEFERLRDR